MYEASDGRVEVWHRDAGGKKVAEKEERAERTSVDKRRGGVPHTLGIPGLASWSACITARDTLAGHRWVIDLSENTRHSGNPKPFIIRRWLERNDLSRFGLFIFGALWRFTTAPPRVGWGFVIMHVVGSPRWTQRTKHRCFFCFTSDVNMHAHNSCTFFHRDVYRFIHSVYSIIAACYHGQMIDSWRWNCVVEVIGAQLVLSVFNVFLNASDGKRSLALQSALLQCLTTDCWPFNASFPLAME